MPPRDPSTYRRLARSPRSGLSRRALALTPIVLLCAMPAGVSAQSACALVADFTDPAANARWRTINDDVMGGRSKGDVRFEDAAMVFAGDINTNGGGFSSVRLELPEPFDAARSRVELRVRSDGRGYRLLLEDAAHPRITYRAAFPNLKPGEWTTVSVRFDELEPSVRGRAVDAPPFDPASARRVGIMLNDVRSGPFELVVDRVEVCG